MKQTINTKTAIIIVVVVVLIIAVIGWVVVGKGSSAGPDEEESIPTDIAPPGDATGAGGVAPVSGPPPGS